MEKNRRLIQVWAGIPLRDEEMGEVRVKVKLTNAADEALAEAGHLATERVRTITVDALVDTGAVRSVIPVSVKQQLGLKAAFQTKARYADGRTEEVEVTTPIYIELEGRPLYEECLVLGDEVLIGQTALEKTDLFVDCINGKLVPNPAHPNSVVMPVRSTTRPDQPS